MDGEEEWRSAVVVRRTQTAVMVRIAVREFDPDPMYCWLRADDVAAAVPPRLPRG